MASELIVQTLKGPTSGANANKVIVPSGHTLTAAGHVLQVVTTGQYSTTWSSSSTSYSATGHKLSITPSSSSSKILILIHTNWLDQGGGIRWYVARNGTNISDVNDNNIHGDYDSNGQYHAGVIMHTDSPNTTSSVEYEIYAKCDASTGTSYIYRTTNVTLMEIAQ